MLEIVDNSLALWLGTSGLGATISPTSTPSSSPTTEASRVTPRLTDGSTADSGVVNLRTLVDLVGSRPTLIAARLRGTGDCRWQGDWRRGHWLRDQRWRQDRNTGCGSIGDRWRWPWWQALLQHSHQGCRDAVDLLPRAANVVSARSAWQVWTWQRAASRSAEAHLLDLGGQHGYRCARELKVTLYNIVPLNGTRRH